MLVAGDDPVPARLAESYARLCAVMRPYGFTADLEFMPWTAIPNLRSALEVIAAAGRPENAGVLVDALHYARSDTRLDEIASIQRRWLHYAQICDAPADLPETQAEYLHMGRCKRLLPGEGGIGLRELYARLPADLPISVEIPNDLRAPACGYREWARQALVATRTVLDAQGRR